VRIGALLVVSACAASGPAVTTVTVDGRRAAWRDWSGIDVCQTEPSWLYDELADANELLGHFTRRSGTWRDDELPVLEAAAKSLGPLLAAHARNVEAAAACPWASEGTWPRVLAEGRRLVAAARAEIDSAPKLVAFVRHRQEVERWRKDVLEPQREAALAGCQGEGVAFAWSDELEGTTWLFCDGAAVNAPLVGGFELKNAPESWPAAQLADRRAKCFEAARNYPAGNIKTPPTR